MGRWRRRRRRGHGGSRRRSRECGGCPNPCAGGVTRGGRDARRGKEGCRASLLAGQGGCGNRAVPGVSVPCREGHSSFQCPSSPRSLVLAAAVAPEWWVRVSSSVTGVPCEGGGSLTSGGWCGQGRVFLFGTLQGAVPLQVALPTNCLVCWAQELLLSSFTKELLFTPCAPRLGEDQSCCSRDVGGHTGTTSHITFSSPALPEDATILACHHQHPGAPLGPEHLSGPGQALLHGDRPPKPAALRGYTGGSPTGGGGLQVPTGRVDVPSALLPGRSHSQEWG